MRFQLEKIQRDEVLRNKRDRKHSHPSSRLDRGDKQKNLEKPRAEGVGGSRQERTAVLASSPTDKEVKPHPRVSVQDMSAAARYR